MIKNIVLDFGHGGLDSNNYYTTAPGKMYTHSNGEIAYEGVLNRQIGGHLYTFLRNASNLNIVCTVKEDDPRDISLQERVRIANNLNAKETLFVSIHCNASSSHAGTGFEIFTSINVTQSDALATEIGESVKGVYEKVNLNLRFDYSDGDLDKESNFYVLKYTNCPAVLLECGFFDNRKDFDLLKDCKFQSEVAHKICDGILNHIKKNDN